MNTAMDPWVITQREKIKYQEQFKSLQPQNGVVTGAQAKGFFLQSQLPPLTLGQIWALADTDSDGKMNITEFSIACKLINLKLRGFEIPKSLPPTLIASLSSAAGTPILTPTGSLSPLDSLKSLGNNIAQTGISSVPILPPPPQPATSIPQAIVPPMVGAPNIPSSTISTGAPPLIMSQQLVQTGEQSLMGSTQIPMTRPPLMSGPPMVPIQQPLIPPISGGVIPHMMPGQTPLIAPTAGIISVDPTKAISPPAGDSANTILPAPPTPPQSNPPSRNMSISERVPSIESPQLEWAIKGPIKLKYTQLFNTTDRTRSGYLTGAQARNLMVQTKLPQATLAQIWALADMDSDGRLGCEEFVLAMYLCDKALAGEKIPVTLASDLIPPSFRKVTSRHGSISVSRQGSLPGSRHASISSQGASVDTDPASSLPQTTFEDKRKENFDKGQAELDRRRKLLMDQQRKEQEERERKERDEIEKREKARLEAERKQQEELDRQLQRQREIEMEKEEQRKRTLEAKEAARKELERQRQLEWENQRIQEMQLQRQREQEKVLKLKAHNQTLNIELSTLNEKIKELSQKICDTRSGVTNVKSVIDGMRSTRDSQMSEMSMLKARIKEQNQKLMQLTQEKAKWDAKSKGSQHADAAHQEQMNAAFSNKKRRSTVRLRNYWKKVRMNRKLAAANISGPNDVKLYDKGNVLEIGNLQNLEPKDTMEAIRKEDLQYPIIPAIKIAIKQLKDKLENIREEIDSKSVDINSNDIQLTELKAELKNLINKCEELYSNYDSHRNQVLEIKHNKKNEAYTSAWDTQPTSSWPVDTPPATTISNLEISTEQLDTQPPPEGFMKYRAVYEFSARNADEITFQPGDIIFVPLEQNAEPGWLAGEINGHTGWFPDSYVEKIESFVSETISSPPPPTPPSVTATVTTKTEFSSYNTQDTYIDNNTQLSESTEVVPATTTTIQNDNIEHSLESAAYNGDIEYYIAAYPYESSESGDLNFTAGEMIMVTKKEGDWWTGMIGTRIGIFPSNYVQKADIGGTGDVYSQQQPQQPQQQEQQQQETKDTVNGNAQQITELQSEDSEITVVQVQQEQQQQQQQQHTSSILSDESKTQEDLDTEVSQINTQSKSIEQVQETYSRPMSRTSSMTPGMRAKKPEIAQVIAPYESTSPEQLSLQRGQLIMIRKKTDSGWWEGELQAKGRRRQIGWFPASYVKILQGGRNSGRNTPVSASKIEMIETILDKVIALYPYKAQNDDELSFEKDDIISVLGRDEPEWWRGELNGLTGLFPSNYVGPFVSSGNV